MGKGRGCHRPMSWNGRAFPGSSSVCWLKAGQRLRQSIRRDGTGSRNSMRRKWGRVGEGLMLRREGASMRCPRRNGLDKRTYGSLADRSWRIRLTLARVDEAPLMNRWTVRWLRVVSLTCIRGRGVIMRSRLDMKNGVRDGGDARCRSRTVMMTRGPRYRAKRGA